MKKPLKQKILKSNSNIIRFKVGTYSSQESSYIVIELNMDKNIEYRSINIKLNNFNYYTIYSVTEIAQLFGIFNIYL